MTRSVKLFPSGKSFDVAAGESVLAGAIRNDVSLNFKCGNGNCKACCVQLLKGQVHYPWKPPLGLTESEKASGSVLICQAEALSDLEIEAKVKVGLMEEVRLHEIKTALSDVTIRRSMAVVESLDLLCHDVMRIRLRLPEPLKWAAGQYVSIIVDEGTRRDFSIANSPSESGLIELHVRRVPEGRFTGFVFSDLQVGSELLIEGPLGTFFLRETSARPLLMIAGGTGFAPVKGIIDRCFEIGMSSPITLYCGARGREDLYMSDIADTWAKKDASKFEFIPVLSNEEKGGEWHGRRGFVHEVVAADIKDASGYDIYIAGPPPMVDAVQDVVHAARARKDRVFSDSFEFGVPSSVPGEEQAVSETS